MPEQKNNELIPVLPLRDTVVFPKMIVPLFVGRDKSINALQKVNDCNGNIVLVTQKKADDEAPMQDDVYNIGTLGKILQMLRLPDGTVKVLIEGIDRIKLEKLNDAGDYLTAEISLLPESDTDSMEMDVMARALISQFEEYAKISKKNFA